MSLPPKSHRYAPSKTLCQSSRKANSLNKIKSFDSLPDAANVRQPVVEALFGVSSTTVWRHVKTGLIPSPRKISERVTVWNVGELRKALAAIQGGTAVSAR